MERPLLELLPHDVARDLISRLDMRACRMLRATCTYWRDRLMSLRVGYYRDPGESRPRLEAPVECLRHFAARAARRRKVRELRIQYRLDRLRNDECEVSAAADLAEALAKHAALASVELDMVPKDALAHAAAIAARASAGAALRRLTDLFVSVDPGTCRTLLADGGAALAPLSALTSLTLSGQACLDPPCAPAPAAASAPQAPPRFPPLLRRLTVAGPTGRIKYLRRAYFDEGYLGREWLEALAAAAPRLEALELGHVTAADAGFDEDPAALPAALMAMTALVSVRGLVCFPPVQWQSPRICGAALLAALPHLRHACLYARTQDGIGELRPLIACGWGDLAAAPCAARLESIAFELSLSAAAAAGAPPAALKLPALRALHVTVREDSVDAEDDHAYPADFAAAFPTLEHAVFGDSSSDGLVVLPPLARVARLPRLARLALAAGEWGAIAARDGSSSSSGSGLMPAWSALRAAPALREVELYDVGVPGLEGDDDEEQGGYYDDDGMFDPVYPLPWRALTELAAALAGSALAARRRHHAASAKARGAGSLSGGGGLDEGGDEGGDYSYYTYSPSGGPRSVLLHMVYRDDHRRCACQEIAPVPQGYREWEDALEQSGHQEALRQQCELEGGAGGAAAAPSATDHGTNWPEAAQAPPPPLPPPQRALPLLRVVTGTHRLAPSLYSAAPSLYGGVCSRIINGIWRQ